MQLSLNKFGLVILFFFFLNLIFKIKSSIKMTNDETKKHHQRPSPPQSLVVFILIYMFLNLF